MNELQVIITTPSFLAQVFVDEPLFDKHLLQRTGAIL